MRVTRLSGAAIELLTHLAADDARIEFHQRDGSFQLRNGTAPVLIKARTVQVLAATRLIIKDPRTTGPLSYTITDHGRAALSNLVRMFEVDE